jgi:hypothetical protein
MVKAKPRCRCTALIEVENDDINKEAIIQVEDYNVISNFTQLVTAPLQSVTMIFFMLGRWGSVLVDARWLGGILDWTGHEYNTNYSILWSNYSILWSKCTSERPSGNIFLLEYQFERIKLPCVGIVL